MTKIIFATNNEHKLYEVKKMLNAEINLVSLSDVDITEDIPEEQDTLEGNAEQKADYVYNKLNCNVFADDTGLEIEALNGEPGVYSARYAGSDKEASANMKKVLQKLSGVTNRKAQFRTSICLILNEKKYFFEGVVKGKILESATGEKGFGYDPIFQPEGYNCSFAEMDLSEKNKISHRGLAVKKLINFLNSQEA